MAFLREGGGDVVSTVRILGWVTVFERVYYLIV